MHLTWLMLVGMCLADPPKPPAMESVEVVEESTVVVGSVDALGPPVIEPDRAHLFETFGHVFGRSRIVDDNLHETSPERAKYALRPISDPLTVVGVILRPVKEANMLLPEKLDPFASKEEPVPEEADPSKAVEEHKEKLRQRAILLGARDDIRSDLIQRFDTKWHYQIQAGGSFREGNNPSASINSQLRAERHTLGWDFVARMGAFYNRLEENANRRIFGQTNFDKNLRGRWLFYGREDLEWDTARLINIRSVTSAGIGFRFVDRPFERLVARLGPTASYIEYATSAANDPEARGGWLIEGDYRRVIGDASRFELTSTAFPDFDSEQQFRIRTESALIFPIGRTSIWNWKLGIRHEYIMNPVQTTQPNDIEGYFAIVYTK